LSYLVFFYRCSSINTVTAWNNSLKLGRFSDFNLKHFKPRWGAWKVSVTECFLPMVIVCSRLAIDCRELPEDNTVTKELSRDLPCRLSSSTCRWSLCFVYFHIGMANRSAMLGLIVSSARHCITILFNSESTISSI
jgi:hypothetical protein